MSPSSIACLVVETDSQRASRIVEYLGAVDEFAIDACSVADAAEAVSCLRERAYDLVISKGLIGKTDHIKLLRGIRSARSEALVLCLVEDEERAVMLNAPHESADDYLFYRDLNQTRLVETVKNAFERRAMLLELKQAQESGANVEKGVYRSLLHRLDLAIFLFSREDGALLFRNRVAEAWAGSQLDPLLSELREYNVLQLESIEMEIETGVESVPSAELKSVRMQWKGQDCSLVTLRNISKRKRFEQAYKSSQRRLDLARKSAGLGLWSWDLRRNEVHFGESWKSQIGYSGSEFKDTLGALKEALHPEDRTPVELTLAMALRGEMKDIEMKYRMKHRDGEYRWFLCRAEVYPDEAGRLASLIGTQIDITERREPTSKVVLETSFGARIRTRMERLASEIEVSAARVRSNFRGDSAIVDEILELERLSRSFSGLNEVLQLDAEEKGQLFEAIDLRYETEQVCRAQASLLPSRIRIKVTSGEKIELHGLSRQGIRYVLTESLACISECVAIDFKSEVIADVDYERVDGLVSCPYVCFHYKGDRVSKANLQVLSSTPHLKVTCLSDGEFAQLRLQFESETVVRQSNEEGAPLALLAEDEGVLRLAIQTMLEKLGYEVVLAEDGAKAVDAFSLRKSDFDLALVDLQMPQVDGYGVVAAIRASREDLAVIRMSGDSNDERSETLDTNDALMTFLAKPFGIAELQATINRLRQKVDVH